MTTRPPLRHHVLGAALAGCTILLTACGGSSSSGSGGATAGNANANTPGLYRGIVQECGNQLTTTLCSRFTLTIRVAQDGGIVVTRRGTQYDGFVNGSSFNVFRGDDIDAFRAVGTVDGNLASGATEFSRKRVDNGVNNIDQFTSRFSLPRVQ